MNLLLVILALNAGVAFSAQHGFDNPSPDQMLRALTPNLEPAAMSPLSLQTAQRGDSDDNASLTPVTPALAASQLTPRTTKRTSFESTHSHFVTRRHRNVVSDQGSEEGSGMGYFLLAAPPPYGETQNYGGGVASRRPSTESSACSPINRSDAITCEANRILAALDAFPEVRREVYEALKRKKSTCGLTTSAILRNSSMCETDPNALLGALSAVRSTLPYELTPARPRINVLSLEGGGVRGYMMAIFLMRLEERMQTPLHRLFHYAFGTSAGGILATAMSLRSEADPTQPRFTAKQLVEMLSVESPNLFSKNWWSCFGLTGPKYKDPTKVFQRLVGEDTLFADGLIRTIVTTYNLEARGVKPITNFPSWECKKHNRKAFEVFTAADVMSSTSAAPTYFPPHLARPIKNGLQDRYLLADGGIGVNNPSLLGLREVLQTYPGAEVTLVSLGTGGRVKPIRYRDVRSAGIIKWLKLGLVDMLMSAPNSLITEELESSFMQVPQEDGSYASLVKGGFYRFDPAADDASMDNIHPDNLRSLATTMQSEIYRPGSQWNCLVRTFEENPFVPLLDPALSNFNPSAT